MKDIRKYMTAFAVAGFVMAVATPGQAFTSRPPLATLTATTTVGGTPTVAISSVTILNRSDNAVAAAIGWTGALPGAGWLVSDQYVQLVTNINTSNGGVQYYTDNTNAAAVPRFTGSVSSFTATPAGLVNATDTTQKLPTAWRASTFTLTAVNPINPNAGAGESFLWFFHEDHAQVAVPSLNASVFGNGDPYATVYVSPATPLVSNHPDGTTTANTTDSLHSGIHFAQAPTEFGGFTSNATTDIYLEADFSGALAATVYGTNRLILEAFSL